MVNDSHSLIPQVEGKKKQYTSRDLNMDDRARLFQNITSQQMKWILLSVDNNILQNLPILREFVGIVDDIYGPSVPHLQCKTFRHKIHHL